MVDIHLNVKKKTDSLLKRIKRKFGLKSKSDAIDAIAQEYTDTIYATQYEHEFFHSHSRDGKRGRH